MKNFWKLLPILALVFVAACGDDHDDHDHEHEHEHGDEPHFCIHAEEDQGNAVDVSAGPASDVTYEHTRIDLTLAADGGAFDIVVDEAGDYTVALSANVPLTITDADGNEVAAEASDEGDQCEGAIKITHTFELDIATYTFNLGAADGNAVSLVIEHAEHEEHE